MTDLSAKLDDDLDATFPAKLPDNWPAVLESRAEATHLGDTKGTVDLLRATAVYLRQQALAQQALRTTEAGPRPLDLAEMDADDEAIEWVSRNLHGLRHDSGTIEYTLSSVVRAYQAGRAALSALDHQP